MYTDIIRYKLADGISESDLKEAAADILEVWMRKQEGFLSWEVGKSESGYVDFVFWKDKASADKAAGNMKDIPTGHPWMKCYEMSSITSEKVQRAFGFRND